jgi:hypothetical protein
MITQILWFLAWPVLIFVSYRFVWWMTVKFEKKNGEDSGVPAHDDPHDLQVQHQETEELVQQVLPEKSRRSGW